jgi:hydrogenase expression/formation protein HypD
MALRHSLFATGHQLPWVLMEVCGGQTHTLMRYGSAICCRKGIELVHGPGCPVCVTPLELIDQAIHIAGLPGVTFTSYGDMLRVPGSHSDLFQARARGADVRVVYSPMDALKIARENPLGRSCSSGWALRPRRRPMRWRCGRPAEGLTEFLHAGFACAGAAGHAADSQNRRPTACRASSGPAMSAPSWASASTTNWPEEFHVPIVVGGFEPVDLLEAISMLVAQLEEGRAEVENQYSRSVELPGKHCRRRRSCARCFRR